MANTKLGQMVMTRTVNDSVADSVVWAKHVTRSLGRYIRGDWGDLKSDEDKAANDLARQFGEDRIVARYNGDGVNTEDLYIITEWDRSMTTILLCTEY